MKRNLRSFRVLMASALALATLVTSVIPTANAQGEPPAPTPIPLDPSAVEAPKVEATEAPVETVPQASPQSAETILWTPSSGTLDINNSGQVNVRISTSADEGGLNSASATYELAISGAFSTPVAATAVSVGGGNSTFDLTAANLGAVNASNTQIKFNIRRLDNTLISSPLYNLSRGGKVYLPNSYKAQGGPSNLVTLTSTGVNACDSLNRVFLHPAVRHAVQNPAGDSWFAANNRINNATLVVSLTNYAPVFPAQFQIWYNTPNTGCNPPTYLTLGTPPNPVVRVSNVPAGIVYFRVVSTETSPGNRPVPGPYIIQWDYATGGGGGGTGSEVEPNNNICQATPLPERAVYNGTDNDQFDFYSISITQSGQIMVLMEGHNTTGTQVQVRAPFRYNNISEDLQDAPNPNCPVRITPGLRKDPYTEPIGNVASPGAQVLTRSGIVLDPGPSGDNAGTANPPQTWFIRVATPNAAGQSGKQYTIRWVLLPPGVTTYPFADKLSQPGPANGNDPLLRVNDPFGGNTREKWYYSHFWANLDKIAGGVDTIQFAIDTWTLSGCEANVFPPDPGRTVPSGFTNNFVTVSNQPSGVMTWKFNKSGAYRIRFRALRSGNVVRADEKAIRVDCGFQVFNNGGLWPFADATSNPGSPVIGPEKLIPNVEPIP